MADVLIVDDEARIASFVGHALSRAGHRVEVVGGGAAALRRVSRHRFDLVVLDLMMPGVDGFEVLESLADSEPPVRVLVLSAIGDVACKVRCLSMGAVDYLPKPFAVAELLARVSARLRDDESSSTPAHWLHAGDAVLDMHRHALVVDGHAVQLSPREFVLLENLMRSPGQVRTREELLAQVWGWSNDGNSNVVDVCVRRLRGKLHRELIETVRNVGYSFVAG